MVESGLLARYNSQSPYGTLIFAPRTTGATEVPVAVRERARRLASVVGRPTNADGSDQGIDHLRDLHPDVLTELQAFFAQHFFESKDFLSWDQNSPVLDRAIPEV